MNRKRRFRAAGYTAFILLIATAFVVAWGQQGPPAAAPEKPEVSRDWLIDDFSGQDRVSALGTKWGLRADRSSGGTSRGAVEFETQDGQTVLHLKGTVASGQRGGYIQAQLPLHPRGRNVNARGHQGLKLRVKGNGESYAVRLRTKDTRFATQYYEARFPTSDAWQEVKLPFTRFSPVSVATPLDPTALRTVALAAAGKDFEADVQVATLAFYREETMYNELTAEEERVILHKGTERPFTGKYTDFFETGVYTCKRCGAELFESSSKFRSHCGWPSFDDQIPGAVTWQPDADGMRTEILCNHCGGHLGHVFQGEQLTPKNTRYCVNSISMDFVSADERNARVKAEPRTERAIFASGCFWGTEYHLQRAPGVISTTVGYTGGHVDNPTYKQVCTDKTGHAEAVEVVYDPTKTNYETLAKLFFETHDFTQLNRQGPDIGRQYRSEVFYLSDEQKQVAERLVQTLREKGYDVKTAVTPASRFWPAEDYHQDYYNKTQKTPYCHIYRRIF
jgi:peptide methionine sulfoxide reductase msrA/msrB